MNIEKMFEKLREEREFKQEVTGTVIGQCRTFCPEYESLDRQLRKDINKFEIIPIKKYQRSAAGKTKAFAEDIRQIDILCEVCTHLFSLLQPKKAYKIYENSIFRDNFLDLYNNLEFLYDLYRYIEDRLKAVRLDITAQSLSCNDSIDILERIIRFYIVFNHLLYEDQEFDILLNFDQLSRTLADLMELYKRNGFSKPEFESYFVLTNIKDPGLFDTESVFKNNVTNQMLIAYHQKNYNSIFCAFRRFDFLSKCLFLPHLAQISERCILSLKNTITDVIHISFAENYVPINSEELILIFENNGIKVENQMIDLKNKNNEIKDHITKRSANPLIQSIAITKIELLINYGNIDLLIRNCIVKQFVVNLISKKSNIKIKKEKKVKIITSENKEIKIKTEHKGPAKKKNKKTDIKDNRKTLNINEKDCKLIRKTIIRKYVHNLIIKKINSHIIYKHVPNHLFRWKNLLNEAVHVLIVSNKEITCINKILKKEKIDFDYDNFPLKSKKDLNKYNFIIFILENNKKFTNDIKKKYFMYNIYVGNANELELEIADSAFINSIHNSKKVIKGKILDITENKTRDEVSQILNNLQSNKKNNQFVEKNIIRHNSHRKLLDCEVYYEAGSI